jgi:hypothetical protein
MSKLNYYDKLKSPKWQKKRLETLEDRGFQCEWCGDEENQLHIHHPYYKKGADPWEYDIDELRCLCEKCHQEFHKEEKRFDDLANKLKSYNRDLLGHVMGYMAAIIAEDNGPFPIEGIDSYEFAGGVGVAYNKTADEVIKAQKNGKLDFERRLIWYFENNPKVEEAMTDKHRLMLKRIIDAYKEAA